MITVFEFILFLFTVLSLAICAALLLYIHKFKKEVKDKVEYIDQVLRDINSGNLNRKVLMDSKSVFSGIAFGINLLTGSIQSRIIDLQKSEEAEKALMTSLSHDIRTPLTTLIGYLDALCTHHLDESEKNNYIKTAYRKANDLKKYTDALFEWFRLSSNEELLEFHSYDMVELTRSILEEWIFIFEKNHIEYEIDIPESDIKYSIDQKAYSRILNNLLDNIITHSRAEKVWICLFKENNLIVLRVSDNGIGIPSSDLNHIFERLYKCDKSRNSIGCGIGLDIVWQLVKKSGGQITVESIPNIQTTFSVSFDAAGKSL